jgi:type II secretory pathway pseudopilin PulG
MFRKKEKGMTIVEMMVVFFIIAVILSISFIGYRQNQQKTVLNSAAFELAGNIRKQQSIVGLDDASCGNPRPVGYKYGYGISLDISNKAKYYLFSDCDGNGFRDGLETGKEIIFPSEVILQGIMSASPLNIVFYPPGPSVMINGESATAVIVIQLESDPLIKRTITINAVGMIDVK